MKGRAGDGVGESFVKLEYRCEKGEREKRKRERERKREKVRGRQRK